MKHETTSPSGSSSQPGDGPGAHSPSIRPCSRWGLAAAASPQSAGRSYRPISPLSRQAGTVCFCATFRLLRHSKDCRRILGVTQHPARRSPDFPPQRSGRPDRCGGHPAYPAPVHPPIVYDQFVTFASTASSQATCQTDHSVVIPAKAGIHRLRRSTIECQQSPQVSKRPLRGQQDTAAGAA